MHIKISKCVLCSTDLLWKQADGEDEERSKAAVGGKDLPKEDAVGAHFASTGFLHRLCRACHPGKKTQSKIFEIKSFSDETIDLSSL